MKYTVDFFISKFEKIPEEDWGTHEIKNKCAYWHCEPDESYRGEIQKAFTKLFEALRPNYHFTELLVVGINDRKSFDYPQPTPKQRILAALYDIKSLQAVKEAETILNTKNTNMKITNGIKQVSVTEYIEFSEDSGCDVCLIAVLDYWKGFWGIRRIDWENDLYSYGENEQIHKVAYSEKMFERYIKSYKEKVLENAEV